MPFSVFLGTLSETDETTRILRHLTLSIYHIFFTISRAFSYFWSEDNDITPQFCS